MAATKKARPGAAVQAAASWSDICKGLQEPTAPGAADRIRTRLAAYRTAERR